MALKQRMLMRMIFCLELAGGSEAKGKSLRWPTPSDLNTRLRRIIAGYQRVVKKAELKKAAAEKVSLNVPQKRHWVCGSPAIFKALVIKNLNFASVTRKAAGFHFDEVASAYNGRRAIFLWPTQFLFFK